MAADEQVRIDSLEKTVEKLVSEISDLREVVKALSEDSGVSDSVKELGQSVAEMKSQLDGIAKIDDVLSTIGGLRDEISAMKESSESDEMNKKLDDILSSISGLGKSIQQVHDRQDMSDITSRLDDLHKRLEVLTGLGERVDELHSTFEETKEIVSIIVRQLDDIERKYNKALSEVSEALALVRKVAESGPPPVTAPTEPTPPPERAPPKKKPRKVSGKALPSTIDAIMEQLLELVTPHTEAVEMARALEETRDRLTDLIKEHTPVIFQFGKMARELKSYPPTATLNENDIARLNKEIRSWTAKLKEVAKGQ
ncbi:MAG: hypothetical protein DRO73_00625 [Candidatus Thorarchaeota archaeon]|nr:MAG: hypothetical protein DRO73_00625 [Candidatus Thorarchaeota archaeon]